MPITTTTWTSYFVTVENALPFLRVRRSEFCNGIQTQLARRCVGHSINSSHSKKSCSSTGLTTHKPSIWIKCWCPTVFCKKTFSFKWDALWEGNQSVLHLGIKCIVLPNSAKTAGLHRRKLCAVREPWTPATSSSPPSIRDILVRHGIRRVFQRFHSHTEGSTWPTYDLNPILDIHNLVWTLIQS